MISFVRRRLRVVSSLAAVAFLLLLGRRPGYAGPSHETVLSFDILPQNPSTGNLTAGPDGSLWGAAESGGAYGFGAIYKVKTDGTAWQPVLSFSGSGNPNKGRTPNGSLVADGTDWLWGTTQLGGASNLGTIFKVNASTGALATVVEFTGNTATNKGAQPLAGLVSDGAGYLWGTTQRGGAANAGTVFKVNAISGVLTTVAEFTTNGATNKGSLPQAGLLNDGAGFFWGTTFSGGSIGWGTVFKVNMSSGALTTVVEFTDKGAANRGSAPGAALVSDGAGFFWGTTTTGGASGHGTVFKIAASTNVLTTLVEFTNNGSTNRGRTPSAKLVWDSSGMLWGTTYDGGANGVGTVFKINPATGVLSTVIDFTYNGATNKGGYPSAGLFIDHAGSMWGTTRYGGPAALGTVFQLEASSGLLTTLVDFTYNGATNRGRGPYGGLVSDAAGALWGTTANGGAASSGTIFKIEPGAMAPAIMADFATSEQRSGAYPYTGLTSDGGRSLWGVTQGGGSSGLGTIFKIDAISDDISTPISFTDNGSANKGSYPSAPLYNDGAGYFWGSTVYGGASGQGTILKVNATTEVLSTVVQFTGNGGAHRGANPYGALVSDGVGSLWGTTSAGGASGFGTVFKIQTETGVLTTLIDFTNIGGANRGAGPWAALVSDGADSLWGSTQEGGASDYGTLFKINAITGVLTTVLDFTRTGATNKGSNPAAPLLYDGAGSFWGTTQFGGAGNWGTVFKIDAATGVLTTLLQFTGIGAQAAAGSVPGYGPLHRHSDGNLYGVTSNGGPGGGGTVFRLRFGPISVTQPASSIASTSAVLNGLVNPNGDGNTTVAFEYGTDPAFADASQSTSVVIANGSTSNPVSISVSDLSSGTTYYCRIRAFNAGNSVPQMGATVSFTTSASGIALWRLAHFGTTADDGNAADLADPNLNGLVNLIEYALGGNPLAATTGPDLLLGQGRSADNHLQVTFTRHLDRPDLVLSIVASDSPSGPWSELATAMGNAPFIVVEPGASVVETGDDTMRQVTVADLFPVTDPLHPRRLLRLKVVR